MSHFTVLTAAQLPLDLSAYMKEKLPDACVIQYAARKLWFERLVSDKGGNDEEPKIPEITDQDRIEYLAESLAIQLLEPYCENTEDPAYLEFIDQTDEGHAEYETHGINCIRLLDGRIVPFYHHAFTNQYELYDGKIYKRRYGQLHSRKRTKKAKKMQLLTTYPFKKLYPTFDTFMEKHYGSSLDKETGRYGYYTNPNATWDWCQVGGRWPLRFLVKEDCPLAIKGESSRMLGAPPQCDAPEGYRWVAGARKCDIAWDVMRGYFQAEGAKLFHKHESWFQAGAVPEEARYGLDITEDGIVSWGDYVYRKGESLEAYLDRTGVSNRFQYPFGTYACVDGDGWISQGNMGWFGISSDDKDESVWNEMTEQFIARQPDEALLVSMDCHI